MNDERLWHLSEEQWREIEGAFPQRRGESGLEAKITNRVIFEAVLFRTRPGCAWRDLPSAYGDDPTLCVRWKRWVKSGVPRRARWSLGGWKRPSAANSIRAWPCPTRRSCAHQHAAGARKKVWRRRGWPAGAGARTLAWRPEHEDPRGEHQREPSAGFNPHRRAGGRRAGG